MAGKGGVPPPKPLTEVTQPDKAAHYIEQRLANSEPSVGFVAKQVGLPISTAQRLEDRLQVRYAELAALKPMAREVHEKRLSQRMEWLDTWLTREKFEQMLEESKLKDVMVADAVMLDKWLILKGQPNQIISTADHSKLDDLGPALLQELNRRQLKVTAKETTRTVEMETAD